MKRSLGWRVWVAVVLTAGICGVALAQKKPAEAFTDRDKAGPDFLIQGEYEGPLGQERLGTQVIAQGDGKFQVVLLPGGLPGADNNGKRRFIAAAKTVEGKTIFEGNNWSGEIVNGKLTGQSPEGIEFALSRIERQSPTLGAKPPGGAVILFDGRNVEEWNNGKIVEENLLKAGTTTKKSFKDFKLHVEFLLPFKPAAKGQDRANSGVYLQNRYEIQVLDSFGLEGKNNECGAIYQKFPPRVNMCLPPLQWQTYDIDFRMARFDAEGKKIAHARLTVLHNGVKVHDDVEVPGPTGHGQVEKDTPGPINFQDHGNPTCYRNIWLVPTAP